MQWAVQVAAGLYQRCPVCLCQNCPASAVAAVRVAWGAVAVASQHVVEAHTEVAVAEAGFAALKGSGAAGLAYAVASLPAQTAGLQTALSGAFAHPAAAQRAYEGSQAADLGTVAAA